MAQSSLDIVKSFKWRVRWMEKRGGGREISSITGHSNERFADQTLKRALEDIAATGGEVLSPHQTTSACAVVFYAGGPAERFTAAARKHGIPIEDAKSQGSAMAVR